MTVYLIAEPFVEVAISYAAKDGSANIVLLEDAVYSSPRVHAAGRAYVMEDDIVRRGLKSRLPSTVRTIGYDELLEMMEKEKVVNFL